MLVSPWLNAVLYDHDFLERIRNAKIFERRIPAEQQAAPRPYQHDRMRDRRAQARFPVHRVRHDGRGGLRRGVPLPALRPLRLRHFPRREERQMVRNVTLVMDVWKEAGFTIPGAGAAKCGMTSSRSWSAPAAARAAAGPSTTGRSWRSRAAACSGGSTRARRCASHTKTPTCRRFTGTISASRSAKSRAVCSTPTTSRGRCRPCKRGRRVKGAGDALFRARSYGARQRESRWQPKSRSPPRHILRCYKPAKKSSPN